MFLQKGIILKKQTNSTVFCVRWVRWSFLLWTSVDGKFSCPATTRTVSAWDKLYTLCNPGVFFSEPRWKSQFWTFVEIPTTAHSWTPLRTFWMAFFAIPFSKYVLVPVIRCLTWPVVVTAADGFGIFSVLRTEAREKILPGLFQFLPTGSQPTRTAGDSWTKKVTGLLLVRMDHIQGTGSLMTRHLFIFARFFGLISDPCTRFPPWLCSWQHGCRTVQLITSAIQDYSINIWKPFTWLSCLECLAAN